MTFWKFIILKVYCLACVWFNILFLKKFKPKVRRQFRKFEQKTTKTLHNSIELLTKNDEKKIIKKKQVKLSQLTSMQMPVTVAERDVHDLELGWPQWQW